jgi:hypothetical protein
MDKVIIKFEKEIKHCYDCPFTCNVYEQGYSGTDCSKLGAYSTIPKEGIREDCPFRNKGKR